MYHVSAQGVDERMINVHYYYYYYPLVPAVPFRFPCRAGLLPSTDGHMVMM